MVERLAFQLSDPFAMVWAAGEHQRRPWSRMRLKNSKHPPLIIMIQMEKTIPGEKTGKNPRKRELPHIRDHRAMHGQAGLKERDHDRR